MVAPPKTYQIRSNSVVVSDHHATPPPVEAVHVEVQQAVPPKPVQLTQSVEVNTQPVAVDNEPLLHVPKDEMNWSKPPRADVVEAQPNPEYIRTKDQPEVNLNVDAEDNLMPTSYDTTMVLPDQKQLQRLGMTKDD